MQRDRKKEEQLGRQKEKLGKLQSIISELISATSTNKLLPTRHGSALDEWIARRALGAAANGNVVHDVARGSLSTGAWTRVRAFVADACPIPRAVCTQHTFWSTSRVRISLVFRQASANSVLTLGVGAARGWVAGI